MKIEQAAKIVVDCIRVTGNFSGPMKPQDELSTLGINTQLKINGLRNRIVNDGNIGVPSLNHTLNPVFLQDLSGDWTVIQLTLVVYNNSVSNTERPVEARAHEALAKVLRKGGSK